MGRVKQNLVDEPENARRFNLIHGLPAALFSVFQKKQA
jgi:hypothetical protein